MSGSTPAAFPNQTAWSMILESRDRAQLERLVATYWKPVCWFLVRRWNLKPDDAADLTQEFFLRLIDEDALKEASPERGRFRTFLKLKLHDLVVDDLRRRTALKRGGGARLVPLGEEGAAEPPWPGLQPDEAFDRDWASCLMTDAIRALESTLRAEGRETIHKAFRLCVLSRPAKSYRECAETLQIKESDVRNFVFRARSLLRDIVRRLVRESVADESAVDEEFSHIVRLFEP